MKYLGPKGVAAAAAAAAAATLLSPVIITTILGSFCTSVGGPRGGWKVSP
jgi:hypothetical protein